MEARDIYKLLDEANDCVLECLNVEQVSKRPRYGAIHHLRDLHQRVSAAMLVLIEEDVRCLEKGDSE